MCNCIFCHSYKKIIRFSVILCVITVFYNFFVLGVRIALKSRVQMITYMLIEYRPLRDFWIQKAATVTDVVMHMVQCLKPAFVALAYIWVKCT